MGGKSWCRSLITDCQWSWKTRPPSAKNTLSRRAAGCSLPSHASLLSPAPRHASTQRCKCSNGLIPWQLRRAGKISPALIANWWASITAWVQDESCSRLSLAITVLQWALLKLHSRHLRHTFVWSPPRLIRSLLMSLSQDRRKRRMIHNGEHKYPFNERFFSAAEHN